MNIIKNILHVINVILLFNILISCSASKRDKRVFSISVFYDDTYANVEDITAYSADIISRFTKKSSFRFEYSINKVTSNLGYKLTKTLCQQLHEGRLAVIAIGTSPVFNHLKSIANSLKIPFIAVKWDDTDFSDYDIGDHLRMNLADSKPLLEVNEYKNFVNIHPPASKIMNAIIDLVQMYKWDHVTVLYQEDTGPERIQKFIQLPSTTFYNSKKFRLQVRQLSSDYDKWIYLIKEIKLSGSSHIIVDIETKYLNKFIQIADEVGLMTSYFHVIFTTLDLSILDTSPSANITALQMFEPNNSRIINVNAEFNLKNMVAEKPLFRYLPSEAAFIYDAFLLLANTIDRHNLADIMPGSPSVSCEAETKWHYGDEFMSFLKKSSITGLSGKIEFDQVTGMRKNLTMQIVDLSRNGVSLVGNWIENKPQGETIHIVRSYEKEKKHVSEKLNRHLIVTTKLEAPYVMLRTSKNNQTFEGNYKYIGFCVQMLEQIARMCNFTYSIKLVDDGYHGAIVNGKWNGIVSELIEKKADLAVAALTINFQREQVIDFTKPFLNLGISILYKRPQKKTPNLFSFLSPLSIEIWLYIIGAYLVVSFMLYVIARFSPYEWENPHPCKLDSGIVKNQFTIMNALWFTIGSLMQQGTDLNPRAPSVRVISGAWAAFTLIIISSYTANLAAFLTVQRMQTPIENAEDLSRQTEIKYGSVNGGSTQNFFKESNIQTYEKMWNFMSSSPDNFVKSTEEGIARIRKGNYAYLLESTTNEYMRQRDCDLMQIGGLLDTKGYGIAAPAGSPWRDRISSAVLQMQENGDIQELYTNWWKRFGIPEKKCEDANDKKDSANELSFENVGGVFVVLAAGLGLAFVIAFMEFTWKAKQTYHEEKSFSERFRNGFGNIIGSFCSARFENTFPKISRIIHFEEPHAPTLRHMITDLNRTASGPSQDYSGRQSLRASNTSLKQHAAEQARIKKRNSTRYEKASSMVHEPEMTLEQLSALTRVVIPNARPRSGDRRSKAFDQ